MSVDYIVHVKRRSDKFEVGAFLANQLKTIIESKHRECIDLNEYSNDKRTFDIDGLDMVRKSAKSEIELLMHKIIEKKFMVSACSSIDIKETLEEDIFDLWNDISDNMLVRDAATHMIGAIYNIVEDKLVDGKFGYQTNADGDDKTLFVDDVYLEIELCY